MSFVNPNPFTTRPEIDGTFGVVTSTHWIATAVGMATLEKGGNAFDAAMATAFTLQVVEPHLNGRAARQAGSDLRPGPGAGRRHDRHYRREGLDLVPGTGLLAACVPGTFETWMLLLRDYGTLPLAEVLAPAIATLRTATRSLSAPTPPSPRSPNCSASIGRRRAQSICRTARRRRPERCSPTV
jgi:gamma-glutamyltranspeptidase / glutathione hydrolase